MQEWKIFFPAKSGEEFDKFFTTFCKEENLSFLHYPVFFWQPEVSMLYDQS